MTKHGSAHLLKTSAQCLLTDSGRQGSQRIGICSGGAADAYAYDWANRLLDNPAHTAAIEITLGPITLEFSHNTRIAICGALSAATLNGKTLTPWSSSRINAGDILSIAFASSGLRTYLAIDQGFIATPFLNSREQLQHDFSPRPLKRGETLRYTPINSTSAQLNRTVHWQAIPDYQQVLSLALHPCYQFKKFSTAAINTLLSTPYSIGANSNRMGYRLEGEPIVWDQKGIVSEGIALGSVQIPPSGEPIVLLNDRQTIGGYPKVGCIRAADCYQLAQRRPGQKVRFHLQPL